MNKNRQYQLLFLASCLLFVKFVFLPVIEWQNSLVDEIALNEKRLSAGLDAIKYSDDYELKALQLQQKISNNASGLYSYLGANAFQLEQQTAFENLATEHDVSVDSASWSPMQTLDSGVLEHRLDVTLVGETEDIIKLQAAAELKHTSVMAFSEYNFVITRHLLFSLGTVRGQATISFFMEPEEGL